MQVSKCCFTGYRPAKFPFELSVDNYDYIEFENSLLESIIKLISENCCIFYTGMAMGFDIIAAESVLLLKKARPDLDIKLVCVIPFEAQGESYSDFWRKKYLDILKEADESIVLSHKYYSGCYQVRNKFMVDNCDYVLTWYDGKSGGTKNTLDYASKKQRQIFNVNKKTEETIAIQTFFELI